MKPLTIEELKALQDGDYIYILDEKGGLYCQLCDPNDEVNYWNRTNERLNVNFWYCNYGTKWLAYKNKEEADGLYDNLHKETAKEIYKRVDEFRKSPDLDPRDSYDCNALDAYNNVCKFINRKYGVGIDR